MKIFFQYVSLNRNIDVVYVDYAGTCLVCYLRTVQWAEFRKYLDKNNKYNINLFYIFLIDNFKIQVLIIIEYCVISRNKHILNYFNLIFNTLFYSHFESGITTVYLEVILSKQVKRVNILGDIGTIFLEGWPYW